MYFRVLYLGPHDFLGGNRKESVVANRMQSHYLRVQLSSYALEHKTGLSEMKPSVVRCERLKRTFMFVF